MSDAGSPVMTGKPYVLHAWELSYFSGKTRCYLRYKGIPFTDTPVNALTLLWKIPRRTGVTVIPVVVTPEGEWLQDTKHIVDVLEARFPQAPVLPATPRQRIAALLIEAWADEWWIPHAMHYRWSYPENFPLFQREAGDGLLPGFPRWLKSRMASRAINAMRGYLPAVGVVPAQHAMLERWTEAMLDVLERHLAVQPFLFGTRPSVADFALAGPLYAHLGRDPWPKKHLVEPRRQLGAWLERMLNPAVGSGEFLAGDAVPDTLKPLFESIGNEFYPMLDAIRGQVMQYLPEMPADRTRLPRSLGMIEFPMAGGSFRRAAMPYTLWMMQRVADAYHGLDAAGRTVVDEWLFRQGAPGARYFDNGLRLRRTGLHVQVER